MALPPLMYEVTFDALWDLIEYAFQHKMRPFYDDNWNYYSACFAVGVIVFPAFVGFLSLAYLLVIYHILKTTALLITKCCR